MRLGEKFNLPVISLIDTPGAYPGIGSEERHIAEAIAVNLREMMTLRVPIIATVIGEGGSGGALGIGVADRVLILENAYYSVISPEACSAILWKDRKHAPEAAAALKLTADDLMRLGVVDEVVPEPEGGAHRDHDLAAANLGRGSAAQSETRGGDADRQVAPGALRQISQARQLRRTEDEKRRLANESVAIQRLDAAYGGGGYKKRRTSSTRAPHALSL